jgi:ADP-heptose:LPS heptosyltransferase
LRLILPGKPRDPRDIDPANIRKILVVRQDNRLGNLVLQVPFLKALKQAFPAAEISVLVGETFAELYRDLPDIHDRILFPHKQLARHPWRWISLVRDLGKGGWDLALECGHPHVVSLNNASLVYLSKAPFRIGFRRGDADIFLNVLFEAPEQSHYARALKSLVGYWSNEEQAHPMSLPLPEIYHNQWQRLWEKAGLDADAKVALIWSGGRYSKRWQQELTIAIADKIAKDLGHPWTPVIGLGPGETDLENVFASQSRIKTLRFDGPIQELWAFLDRCWVMISGDTGPLHLAAALGIPTFGIFQVYNVWEYGHNDRLYHRAIFVGDDNPIPDLMVFVTSLPEKTCPRSTICY